MPQAAFQAIVSGRVQMVMYRDFAARRARRLGITGEVANLRDGSVRVIAEGSKESLDHYLAALRQGSFWSRVDDVRAEWREPTGAFRGFTINYRP